VVLGVPPNVLDFLPFASIPYETNEYLASRVPQSSSLPMLGCCQKFLFKKGAVKQKRLRNTDLDKWRAYSFSSLFMLDVPS